MFTLINNRPIFVLRVLAFTLVFNYAAYSSSQSQNQLQLHTQRDPASVRARLERLVRHELVMLPYYSVFDNLGFKVEGNQIELLGQVTRPTLKSDSEQVVKSIEGVEEVKNNIEVLPVSFQDDRIRLSVYRAVYGYTALQRYGLQAVPPIHIIVKNGNVALEGIVANEADKNIAGIQANGVSGVFSVTNNLQTEK